MAVDLRTEVDYIINDVKLCVNHIELSSALPQEDGLVYFNIKTNEKKEFCVELTQSGFKVVGSQFDSPDGSIGLTSSTFETVYALLQDISPSYVQTFGNQLISKLSSLENRDTEDASMDSTDLE